MKPSIYIVFKTAKKGPEIQGAFTSKTKAAKACRVWSDQVMILPRNQELPRRRSNALAVWWHPQSNQVRRGGKWRKAA